MVAIIVTDYSIQNDITCKYLFATFRRVRGCEKFVEGSPNIRNSVVRLVEAFRWVIVGYATCQDLVAVN